MNGINIGDKVCWDNRIWIVVAVHNCGRMVDLYNPDTEEKENMVYVSDLRCS